MEPRRGTKANPFEIGEKVRTRYFRGAAPERESVGIVEEVDEWKGSMALHHVHKRYLVRWVDPNTNEPLHPHDGVIGTEWLTCRGLESIERPRLEIDFKCPSCGSDPDVDCICKPGG